MERGGGSGGDSAVENAAHDARPALRDPSDDRPVLPDRADDDRDVGWGERGDEPGSDAEQDRRLLEERPPHHDGRSSW